MGPDLAVAFPLWVAIVLQTWNIRAVVVDGEVRGIRPYSPLWSGIAALFFSSPSLWVTGLYVSSISLIFLSLIHFTYAALIFAYSKRGPFPSTDCKFVG